MKKFKFNIYFIFLSIVLFCSSVYADTDDDMIVTRGSEMGGFKKVDTIPENYIYDEVIKKEYSSLIDFDYSFPVIFIKDIDKGDIGERYMLSSNDDFVIKKGDKDKKVYINKEIVENHLSDAKKVYEDRIRIYQIGEKIKKESPRNYEGGSFEIEITFESVAYAKEYNGKTAGRNKKFFIAKLKNYIWDTRSSNSNPDGLIYEVFSTNGTRYIQYDYNEKELSYGFEIDEEEEIEFMTICNSEQYTSVERNFRRTIRVLEEGEESSIKLNELEFKKVDTIPKNYIEIEKFPFPLYVGFNTAAFEDLEKYTYVDKEAQSICFYFHLPYIYVTDLDGGIFETVTMDSTAFLKSNKNGKVYVKDSFIQKYLDRANQVKEEREKTYHLGETITKTANNDSQKKVEYIVESSKYTNEYNGKKAEDDRIFFIVKLKKREVIGFSELEKKSIRTVKYLIDDNDREEYGYEKIYNPEEDSYCFEISKDTIISSLVIGIGEEKNESTDFEIGKDFFREIKL